MDSMTFDLSAKNARRPVFTLSNGCKCLFDTGAEIGVLMQNYLNAFGEYPTYKGIYMLKGFGGSGIKTPVYFWKHFTIIQGSTRLTLDNYLAYVTDESSFNCIIPYTPFTKYHCGIAGVTSIMFFCPPVIDCGFDQYVTKESLSQFINCIDFPAH